MSWTDRFRRFPVRLAAVLGIALLIGLAFSLLHLGDALDHLDARMLSGPEQGNYHAVVEALSRGAARRGGTLRNEATNGTVDNLARLAAAADDCSAHFALAQDGVPPPEGSELELIGKLNRPEAVFFAGRDAARLRRFSELQGMRIGIGPPNSGTDHLARQIFESEDFASLGLRLGNYDLAAQLDLLERGELDLGVFVMATDSTLMRRAVRERGIQIASFDHLGVIASRYPFATLGTIPAGLYDPVRVLPAEEHPVLLVDTLVVGNGCASRSATMGLLTLLSAEIPEFIAHNKSGTGAAHFAVSGTAQEFFDAGGPGWADTYLPWLVDIMPLGYWFYVVMTISVLFNAMSGWHRLRLWRVDANRDKAQQLVRDALGETLTPDEIARLEPEDRHRAKEVRDKIDAALAAFDAQRIKCRKHQNSILVPMGQEWIYRYEEEQMELTLTALRGFRDRLRA